MNSSTRFDMLAKLNNLHQMTALELILSELSWSDINVCFSVSVVWRGIVENVLLNNVRLKSKLLEKKFIHDWFHANPGVLSCQPFSSLSGGTVVEQCLIAANKVMVLVHHMQSDLCSFAMLDLITMKWSIHTLDLPFEGLRVGRVKDLSEHLLLFEKTNFGYFVFSRKTFDLLVVISSSMEADNLFVSMEKSILQQDESVLQVRTLNTFLLIFYKRGRTLVLSLDEQQQALQKLCYIDTRVYKADESSLCELNGVICFNACQLGLSSVFYVDLKALRGYHGQRHPRDAPQVNVVEVVLPKALSHVHLKLIRAAQVAVVTAEVEENKMAVIKVDLNNKDNNVVKLLMEESCGKETKPAVFVTDNHIVLALKQHLKLFSLNDETPLVCVAEQHFRCPFSVLGIIHERLVALHFGSSYSSRRRVLGDRRDSSSSSSSSTMTTQGSKTSLVAFVDLKSGSEVMETWREFHVMHENKPNPYHMELYSQGLVHCAHTWHPNLARDDLDIRIWQFAI